MALSETIVVALCHFFWLFQVLWNVTGIIIIIIFYMRNDWMGLSAV